MYLEENKGDFIEIFNNTKIYSTLCTSMFREINRVHSYPVSFSSQRRVKKLYMELDAS